MQTDLEKLLWHCLCMLQERVLGFLVGDTEDAAIEKRPHLSNIRFIVIYYFVTVTELIKYHYENDYLLLSY